MTVPSETGKERYYPDGYYDGTPCTCKPDCSSSCKGECGCSACASCYGDHIDEY